MKTKVEKIAAHGCNVFINRQLIYNYPEQLFKYAGMFNLDAHLQRHTHQHPLVLTHRLDNLSFYSSSAAGITSIEHSDFDGMERLAAALGGEIISTFDHPESAVLGECELIEEILIGEETAIRFSGCKKREACTIILRGASEHVLGESLSSVVDQGQSLIIVLNGLSADEAERSLHDALAVVSQTCQEPLIVYGGGAAEMAMADAVDRLARTVEGKKSLAIEAFAEALRAIPTVLLDNGGFDSADIVAKLRALHTSGSKQMGVGKPRNVCVVSTSASS